MQKVLEKDIQNSICEYLALKRYMFWRQNTAPTIAKDGGFRSMGKYSMNGIPDIILILQGIFIGLEVKRPGGKQSENQEEFQRKCEEAGGRYHLVQSLDDVISLGL